MENLLTFFGSYGMAITIIAVLGIALLGTLKYLKLFKKVDESKRHYIYLAISVGFSIIATIIYLLVVGQFEINYVLAISTAIYALNQTFYNIFKITPINDLTVKILDNISARLDKNKQGATDKTDSE